MKISVVVPASNVCESLHRLLLSLNEQKLQPSEIIVVLPRPVKLDKLKEIILKAEPETRVIELSKDPGPIRARVFGGLIASSPLVAFIDSDCKAPPEWLEKMVAELTQWNVEVVAGSVNGANIDNFIARMQERSIITPNPKHKYKLLKDDIGLNLIVTANMLVRKEVLLDDGVVPPSYKRYGFEDLDFAVRLTRNGYKILCSPTRVLHYNRTSFSAVLKRYYQYGRGLPLFRKRVGKCIYSKVVSMLVYFFLMILVLTLTLLVYKLIMHAITAFSLIIVPLLAYHFSKLSDGGWERLIYPLTDLALATASAIGVLCMEFELLLNRRHYCIPLQDLRS
ncbi:MAG: glycosyltransferase family 2 protein [Thermofilaceae archaeon]